MASKSLAPICFRCRHFRGVKADVGFTCDAFGEKTSIPIEIIVSSADHRKPYKGDNGKTFESIDNTLATDPPVSTAQRRAMFAAARGKSTLGIPQSVGEEFTEAGKLPKKARDMDMGEWKLLRWLLGKFFSEEEREEEHKKTGADECVQQIRNLLGEFRRAHPARDVAFEEILDTIKGDPEVLVAWIKDRIEHNKAANDAGCDTRLAHDEIGPWWAIDHDPTRKIDDSGHMHVKDTVLSKAIVSPYLGKEINGVMKDEPDWKMLAPEETYHLLRDPKELEKSVDTWNGKPLLWIHRGVSADDHPASLVVGSTGTNAHLKGDELINDLAIWPRYATMAVENGERKSLSCGYAYKADMTPGDYKGRHYDGIMRDISGNHVAFVDHPRVPGAEVGGDSLGWDQIAEALLMV